MLTVTPETSDEALVPGLAARDEAAVATLLERYWARAYRVAYQQLRDPAAAEDVAQETFVRVLQAAERFEAGRAFRPWFFRILANTARTHRRGSSRRAAREARVARPELEPPTAETEVRERNAIVREHLARLAPKLRDALTLRYLEEMSLAEVAETLGCPEGTVSSRIRRGLESMRRSLQPVTSFGAMGGVVWLRQAMQVPVPAGPGASELAAAATAPLTAAELAELEAAPELAPPEPTAAELADAGAPDPGLNDPGLAGAAGDGAGEGAGGFLDALPDALAGAPPPPSPRELIELAAAGTSAAAASSASKSLAPALALLLAVGAGVGTTAVLLPGESASPQAKTARFTPTPAPAHLAPLDRPGLSVVLPERLTVGDRVEVIARVRWPGHDAAMLELVPTPSERLSLVAARMREERVTPAERTEAGWRLELEALQAGTAELRLTLSGGGREGEQALADSPVAHQARVELVPPDRRVRLVHNVELEGPDSGALVQLDPRLTELRSPRSLRLRTLPGTVAEAELSLEGFARVPHGCFEQTSAATYPSALVLELRAAADPADRLAKRAQTCAVQGAARLRRFQAADGSFSLHGKGPPDPWLTAVGLAQLTQLARVVTVEPDRLERAAAALLRWQETSGRFAPTNARRWLRAVPHESDLAVTAYSAASLLGAEAPGADRSLEWLSRELGVARAGTPVPGQASGQVSGQGSSAPAAAPGGAGEASARDEPSSYVLALAAKAFQLAPGYEAAAETLVDRLAARAERPKPGQAAWGAEEHTLTGTHGRVVQVEVTGLVAQVLAQAGRDELAAEALGWLAAARTDRGFGSTQATVQALEAFRVGRHLRVPARGSLELRAGPQELGALAVEAGEGMREHALEAVGLPPDSLVDLAQGGVQLRFRGEGRLRAQLVVEGTVPWDARGWGRNGERQAGPHSLSVQVERPGVARVGQPQRWTISVSNLSRARAAAPMAELELPPGFVLHDEDGGLGALVDAGLLHHHELWGERLDLYLRDLEPGEEVRLPLLLLPTLAGSFAGGTLVAYPYYRADDAVVRAPVRLRVVDPTAPGRADSAPEPELASSEDAIATQPAPPEAEPPEEASGGRRELRIAWDADLGPLDLEAARFHERAGPLERLLGRALYAGIPECARRSRQGDTWQFDLRPRTWSDGTPMALEDFESAWSTLRRVSVIRVPQLGLHVDVTQLDLLGNLEAQPVGVYGLQVRSRDRRLPERLSAFPFFPRPPREDREAPGGLVTNGPYRVHAVEEDGTVVLVRRERISGPERVLIRPVERRPRRGFDLLWSQRWTGDEDDQVIRGGLIGARMRREDRRIEQAIRTIPELAESGRVRVEGVTLLAPKRWRASGRGDPRGYEFGGHAYSVGYTRDALRPLAQLVHAQVREAGLPLQLEDRAFQEGDREPLVLLDVGDPGATFHLGQFPVGALALQGKLDRAFDLNGYLRWPPRLKKKKKKRKKRRR